jgi:hypothetical protein
MIHDFTSFTFYNKMELYPIHSYSRTKSDIRDIEQLGDLINQLGLNLDVQVTDAFQRLVELAGSKDFLPLFSHIQNYALKLKWAREGRWNTGYVVPWMNLYSSLGSNTHLVSVAAHFTQTNKDDDSKNFKSPLIKTPQNYYGNGVRPVEIHREEWYQVLQIGLSSPKVKDYPTSYIHTMRTKRTVKPIHNWTRPQEEVPVVQEAPKPIEIEKVIEKKQRKKRDPAVAKGRRAAPYTKSKIIYDLEKMGQATLGHVAAAADPPSTTTK